VLVTGGGVRWGQPRQRSLRGLERSGGCPGCGGDFHPARPWRAAGRPVAVVCWRPAPQRRNGSANV